MHSRNVVLAVAALLAGNALAAQKSAVRSVHSLFRRQDYDSQAFQPGSESRIGDTCEEAGGAGYINCGPASEKKCFNPDAGDTCCENGGWVCTTQSFCLVENWCCPDGLDPASCAAERGVTLPEGFSATTNDAAVAEATTEETTETTTEVTSTKYPTEHANTTYPAPTGTDAPDQATDVTMFTGVAARPQQVLGGLVVGAALVLAGSLL
ncbi:MAG: hypothetical protein M1815_004662 [Lichina confinis]|nr:MAG: hypothetical protein M1815_004662 [Lichina confinis]